MTNFSNFFTPSLIPTSGTFFYSFFHLYVPDAATAAGEVFAFVHYCTFPNKGGRLEEEPVASDLFPFLPTFLIPTLFCKLDLKSVFCEHQSVPCSFSLLVIFIEWANASEFFLQILLTWVCQPYEVRIILMFWKHYCIFDTGCYENSKWLKRREKSGVEWFVWMAKDGGVEPRKEGLVSCLGLRLEVSPQADKSGIRSTF